MCPPLSPNSLLPQSICRKRISIKRHAAAVVAGFADGAMAQLPMATAVVPMIQVLGGDDGIMRTGEPQDYQKVTPKHWMERFDMKNGRYFNICFSTSVITLCGEKCQKFK